MAIQISISNAIGSRGRGNIVPPFDPDAQAFITAAGITDATQQSAINQLVIDLKSKSIWTKFKAIYPIVGGVASSHAVNLKTPGTYNLTFATGMTHSSTGMTPNGAGAYANTALNASTVLTQYSTHLSYYSRTSTQDLDELIMGVGKDDGTLGQALYARRTNDLAAFDSGSTTAANRITYSNTDGTGLYLGSVTAQTSRKAYKNGVLKNSNTNSLVQSLPNANVFICCYNAYDVLGANYFTNKQCAFASIGDGLSDTEAANFYTAVQAYQTTLGRQVGVPIVSDADAQAFLNAAVIEDVTQANAINDLVIGMKADGLWTKMKAIYPIVGGSASSHAVNLKTPGTYNLSFTTAWTHSSTGMTPDGASAYANTNMLASVLSQNSAHLSYYSRSNTAGGAGVFKVEMGNLNLSPVKTSTLAILRDSVTIGVINASGVLTTGTVTDTRGYYIVNRESSTSNTMTRNGSLLITSNDTSITPANINVWIGARNSPDNTAAANYTDRECAFASMGDGLTSTERTNLYNRVNTFQTTLNRNV